jgi:hypothetical protein
LYMPIFSCIFLSNYWWHKSDIWSQASYRYHISWEAFQDSHCCCFVDKLHHCLPFGGKVEYLEGNNRVVTTIVSFCKISFIF